MAKSKFFRVAVEGATVDGRVIQREWLEQCAAGYNPATYAARINCEHIAGYSPDKPFNAYGTVASLKTEEVTLSINGAVRQHGALRDLIWTVPEILHELSKLWQLRAGDLVFMGTPSGVAALKPGDRFSARLENVAERHGVIAG